MRARDLAAVRDEHASEHSARVYHSAQEVPMPAPRLSARALLATSLGTCMITVMGIKAREFGVDLDGVKIEVLKIMKSNPRRVGGINLTFHIPGELKNLDEKTRELLKNTGIACPVQLSIHPDIEVNLDWGSWS